MAANTSDQLVGTTGYAVVAQSFAPRVVETLRIAMARLMSTTNPGARGPALKQPAFQNVACDEDLVRVVKTLIGEAARPVRMLLFDKTAEANWSVPWHQDLSIAVKAKAEMPGYSGWSVKDGVHHVQPPPRVMESMVTCRIHLDDADESNGALRVVPGSHLLGRIRGADVTDVVGRLGDLDCSVKAGDCMMMKPLILHASRKSENPMHRRVIHIEFAAIELPKPLEWCGI